MKLEWRDVSLGGHHHFGPPISTSLTVAETEELQRLAKDANVLEVGSAYGYSAVAMALAGATVVAVDRHTDLNSYGVMMANLAAYGVSSRVDIRCGDSRTVLPELAKTHAATFDVAWIDGGHEAEVCAHDVEWAQRLVRPGGVIAVHDHGEITCPGVAEALDAWRPYDYIVDTLAVYRIGDGAGPGVAWSGEASRGEARHGWAQQGPA